METSNYLKDGYLPGWPARMDSMLTGAGTQLFHFLPGEDEIVPISATYSVTLEAQNRTNLLLGKCEKGGYYGDLSEYYPEFIYDVLGPVQNRVIDCLNGKNREMRKVTQESLAEIAEKYEREQDI